MSNPDTENGDLPVSANDENGDEKTTKKRTNCKTLLKENLILIFMIAAIAIGVGMGVGLRSLDPPLQGQQIVYLAFPGTLLMRLLKLLILPVIVSSIISGVASLGSGSGKLGLAAVIYYASTTLIAVLLGLLLVATIQPGASGKNIDDEQAVFPEISNVDALLDLVRNFVPDNIVSAAFQRERTKVTTTVVGNETHNTTETTYETEKSPGLNVLGIIMFSLAFGAAVGYMDEAGEPVKRFFEVTSEASMKLVFLVMWYSPIGIVFLIAKEVISMDNPTRVLEQLGLYMGTVLAGLLIHGVVILPTLLLLLARRNPLKFAAGMASALLTAFGTASSAATLPVSLRCLEENNHIDRRVTRFVLPVGATINMDGTALYEAVAGVFIAQLNGVEMDFVKLVTTCLTATLASIGAAGVPQAGLVTLIIVIGALGLPADDIAKILAIDWFLDRFRTTMNVWGDSIGAACCERLCGGMLRKMDGIEEEKKEKKPWWKRSTKMEDSAAPSTESARL